MCYQYSRMLLNKYPAMCRTAPQQRRIWSKVPVGLRLRRPDKRDKDVSVFLDFLSTGGSPISLTPMVSDTPLPHTGGWVNAQVGETWLRTWECKDQPFLTLVLLRMNSPCFSALLLHTRSFTVQALRKPKEGLPSLNLRE